ncbi:MAG: ribonuclease Z [Proteobacteria bacterium]|nr:MAG: ribonuclease Z [Pseudomonadota bacterium]
MAHLQTEFPNGLFGDPALYIWDTASKRAILIDCGDLSCFLPRQLLRVSHIFLSHCHMDHFCGFDHFLRLHMGKDKKVVIMGPPETSDRVEGKLRGYTWNLVSDQHLRFEVHDLDFTHGRKRIVEFHARDAFKPSASRTMEFDPAQPLADAGAFRVNATLIDHLTPCLAYAVEQRPSVQLDRVATEELCLPIGPWIGELKRLYYVGKLSESIRVPGQAGEATLFSARELAARIFTSRSRQKIAYVTDGAPHASNEARILKLIKGADLLFHESCFAEAHRHLAEATCHFTARFVGSLAKKAFVKELVPFHFSKRYISNPRALLSEAEDAFGGKVRPLPARPRPLPALRNISAPTGQNRPEVVET